MTFKGMRSVPVRFRIPVMLLAVMSVVAYQGCVRQQEFVPLKFPAVEVPVMYADDQAEAFVYLSEHFWDDFTDTSRHYPCDSSLVSGVKKGDVEQEFANFTAVLQAVDYPQARKAMTRLFDRVSACERADTSSNIFETVTEFAERYLYDPNSPLRDEDLYGVYAARMAGYDGISETEREAYAYDAQMCSLNEVGSQAADFVFSDASGRMHSLYGIDAEYTLLFFSNPGCEACKYIIDALESDTALGSMVSSGRLAVANIYIDEDIEAWYGYQDIYPDSWYNGYDPDFIIRTDLLYNVRAIPSLYLLDRDKKVLLKDAPEDRVFAALHRIGDGQ